MKITKDNFVWKIVTDKAKEVFNTGLFDLYVLREDESESLIENYADITLALEKGLEIGIEVGNIEKSEMAKENRVLIYCFKEIRSQLIDGKYKEDSILIKAIDSAIEGRKEIRVYLVDGQNEDFISHSNLSDGQFITIAEEEGKVYTLQGFVDAFNQEEINTFVDFIRII